jgi:nucleolar protein 53
VTRDEDEDVSASRVVKSGGGSRVVEKMTEMVCDLWADEAPPPSKKRAPRGRRDRPKGVENVAAVEVPLPGSSVNPSLDDHQDAVGAAVAVELAKEEEERLLKERVDQDSDFHERISDVEHSSDEESESEVEEGGVGYTALAAAPLAEDRKTTVQKNREMRLRAEAEAARKKAELKSQRRQIDALRSIAADVDDEEERRAEARERRDRKRAAAAALPAVPKRGGKVMEDDRRLEVTLSSDLAPTMRQTKTLAVGDMAKDRFRSLIQRSVVEVGRKQRRKKGKKKVIHLPKAPASRRTFKGRKVQA